MSADNCWQCGKATPRLELFDIPVFRKYTVKWCFKCANKQLKNTSHIIKKR